MDRDEPVRRPWSKPGPFAPMRDRYVASFAGVSYDLAPGALGVDPGFLDQAPELPGRIVTVSHEHTLRLRAAPFLVVSLTRSMRNALVAASEGGVVFSSFDLDDPTRFRVLEGLDLGAAVFLNAAIGRLPDIALRRPFDDGAAS